jgi:NDP-sugar pyrophosphorylase family protein
MKIMSVRVVILVGGIGTLISDQAHVKPQPMAEIVERPILWCIMNTYFSHGVMITLFAVVIKVIQKILY